MSRFFFGLSWGTFLALSAVCIQVLFGGIARPFNQLEYAPLHIQIRDAEGALARLARGLSYRTVSNSNKSDHIESRDAFRGLHVHITQAFPRVHRELHLKKVPPGSATLQ